MKIDMYVHFEDTNLATCVCSLKQENLQKSIELPTKSLNNNSVLLSIRVFMITLVFLQSLVQFQYPMLTRHIGDCAAVNCHQFGPNFA